MTGLTMMLNALGVKIDPEELERQFNEVKNAIPEFARKAQETLASIDARLDFIKFQNIDIQVRLKTLESILAEEVSVNDTTTELIPTVDRSYAATGTDGITR